MCQVILSRAPVHFQHDVSSGIHRLDIPGLMAFKGSFYSYRSIILTQTITSYSGLGKEQNNKSKSMVLKVRSSLLGLVVRWDTDKQKLIYQSQFSPPTPNVAFFLAFSPICSLPSPTLGHEKFVLLITANTVL